MPSPSLKEVNELSVSLRELDNRITVEKSLIDSIISNLPDANAEYKIAAFKVLGNYVADVPANASYLADKLENISSTIHEGDENWQVILKIYFILLANILTTNGECLANEKCIQLFSTITNFVEFGIVKKSDLENECISVINSLCELINGSDQNAQYILDVTIDQFEIWHAAVKGVQNEQNEPTGNSLLFTLSTRLKEDKESKSSSFFIKLLTKLKTPTDDQILLNVAFATHEPSEAILQDFLIGIIKDDQVLASSHIGSLLLILANAIVSNSIKEKIISCLPKNFANQYFANIYSIFDISKPWDFQSILLLMKLPLNLLMVDSKAINTFTEHLDILINETTLQLRQDVILLQFKAIGQLLSAALSDVTISSNKETILLLLKYLDELCRKEEYKTYPIPLRHLVQKIYFEFLSKVPTTLQEHQILELELSLSDRVRNLVGKIKVSEMGRVDLHYLLSLSTFLGVYAQIFGKELWYSSVLNDIYSLVSTQAKAQSPNDKGLEILLNNLEYAKHASSL